MFRLKYIPHITPSEQIVFFLRRHPFVLAKIVIFYLFLGSLPVVFYFFFEEETSSWLTNDFFGVFFVLLGFTFYLYWWMLFYYSFLDYFLDVWVVTNHRVINIEQKGLFNRLVAEHKLYRIQDVVSQQKGILPTFFDYGQIHIQTAGAEKTVIFKEVPKPHETAREITRLIENHKKIMAHILNESVGGQELKDPAE